MSSYAEPELSMMVNAARFGTMLMGAVLLGFLARWALRERRRHYMGIGIGLTLLVIESVIDHFLRLDQPPTWRLPVDVISFTFLIFSLEAINRALNSNDRPDNRRIR